MDTVNNASRSITIKDDRLDIDHIDHYSLSFFIGSSSIQITVFDEKKKRLLRYEKYDISDKSISIIDVLEEIHKEHTLISAGFWQAVKVQICSEQFSVVPSALFDFEHQFDYVKLNAPTNPNVDAYRSVTYEALEIAFVFALDKKLVKWFSDKYFNTEVRHSHNGINFIRYAHKQLSKRNDQRIFVNLGQETISVVGLNAKGLAIFNQFPVTSAEQLVKYILLAIKQVNQLGQSANITLWGVKQRIDESRPVLAKYFKNLSIGGRPKIKMSPQFGKFEHYEIMDVLCTYT